MGLLKDGNKVEADNQSIAIGGHVNAPVTLINHLGPSQADMIQAFKMAIADSGSISYIPGPKEIEWQSELEKLIDQYGEHYEQGQIKIAKSLFEGLLSTQEANLTPHLMYRVKANIAICMHMQGQHLEAAKLLHEACDLSPETPKAQANKVLAYLLENNPRRAYEFGIDILQKRPDNEHVAAYVIQAIRIDTDLHDPYPEWSEELKLNVNVGSAYVDYLQSKKDSRWKELAKSLIDSNPEKTKNLAAQFYLDKATQLFNHPDGELTGIDKFDFLKKACELYEEEWKHLRTSDQKNTPLAIANTLNLLICFGLLRNKAGAEEVCEFILSNYAEDQQAMELVLQASVDFNLQSQFELVIKTNISEVTKKKYLLANNIRLENWKDLSKIQDYQLERYETDIKPFAYIACYASQAILRNAEGKRKLEKYISQNNLEKRARTLLFDIAIQCKFPPIIQIAYEFGLSRVTSSSDFDEKFLFASVAKNLNDWRTVITLLKSQPESPTGEAKGLLALAYINDYPIREDAAVFFDNLSLEDNMESYNNLLCGLFYTKRSDFPKACKLLHQYLDQGGKDACAMLALSDIYRLENNKAELIETVNRYDLQALEGTPEQKMHLAKLLVSFGNAEAGMEYAFTIYDNNKKSSDVALRYVHIF
jgi:predicted Zn-dependent protease